MTADTPAIDVNRKFVRLIEERADGLVEFEFAIGEPELFVEMLLPAAAYQAFCAHNAVTRLPPRGTPSPGADSEWNWSLHQATHQRFR